MEELGLYLLSSVFEKFAFFGLNGSILLLRQQAILKSGSPNVDTTEPIQELLPSLPSTPKHRQIPSHVRISHLDENSAIVFKQWLTLDRPGVKICSEQAKGSDVVMRHISIKDG